MTPKYLILPLALLLGACVPGAGEKLMRTAGLSQGSSPGVATAEMNALIKSGADGMVLRIPARGLAVTLLKAGERDGVIRWRATDNVQIYTRDGLIIGTRGFGFDLMSANTGRAAEIIAGGGSGQNSRAHYVLDGTDHTLALDWRCEIEPAGSEEIRVSETAKVMAHKVTETCHGGSGDFVNEHWVVGGAIVQTWQMLGTGPDPGQIRLLFLR